jgi:small multidrug resistance pump
MSKPINNTELKPRMNAYVILFSAITCEVIGTMLLPASQSFTKIIPTILLTLSYVLSFYLLALIAEKIPLPILYASWAGLGVCFVAVLNYLFYKQTLSWQAVIGLFLIIVGVSLVNIFKGEL